MNRLALFDIDKTLLKVLKAHYKAFSVAFKEVYGIDADINDIRHDGMTDQQIIIEILKHEGLDEGQIMPKMKECIEAAARVFHEAADIEQVTVLDGVHELLKEMEERKILIGLVTGNIEAIAKAKLKKAGIERSFCCGGFGDDHIDRTRLVEIAIQRAEEKSGLRFREFKENVFLFGDAPQDMRAGKETGVMTIGVATGIFSKAQLKDAGADLVLENLKKTAEVMKIVLT